MRNQEQWADYFSAAIRDLRASTGLTVSAMAEVFGVDERTYRKYEKGVVSPQVIDFCCVLDKMDAPILRPILNFMHPDIFAGEPASVEDMRGRLAYYFQHVASDRVTQQVYHNMLGQVADNVAPQLEMVNAMQQLPLLYRVMVVKFLLSVWELAEDRGELVHREQVQPDIQSLKEATSKAEAACKQMKESYKTIVP